MNVVSATPHAGAAPTRIASNTWYRACIARLARFESSVTGRERLDVTFAHWSAICSAASDAINADRAFVSGDDEDDHASYVNASPLARWLLRRLG